MILLDSNGAFLFSRYQSAIPPSPPAEEAPDPQRPGIRFQVTLEEGEGEAEAPMWRRLLGLCRKLTEKVQQWWRVRQ